MALLRIVSDLHLEAFLPVDVNELLDQFIPADPRDSEAILVLAGDISSKKDQLVAFLSAAEKRFKHVVFVCGNHEWYRNEMLSYGKELKTELSEKTSKVSFAVDDVLCHRIDDVRFIFGTMWTDGGADYIERERVQGLMNDFCVIGYGDDVLTVSKMQELHRAQRRKVENFLANDSSGMTNVVVSHHMPSRRLCHPRFGGAIDGGFAFNGDAILAGDHAPALWIHGHTHDTIDMQLYNTRVVCNPCGYRGEFSMKHNSEFNSYSDGPKFIEV